MFLKYVYSHVCVDVRKNIWRNKEGYHQKSPWKKGK